MPITPSAKKKERQDKKRQAINLKQKNLSLQIIRDYKKKPSPTLLKKVYSVLDSDAKKKILHKNKVNRLKRRLTKLLKKTSP